MLGVFVFGAIGVKIIIRRNSDTQENSKSIERNGMRKVIKIYKSGVWIYTERNF